MGGTELLEGLHGLRWAALLRVVFSGSSVNHLFSGGKNHRRKETMREGLLHSAGFRVTSARRAVGPVGQIKKLRHWASHREVRAPHPSPAPPLHGHLHVQISLNQTDQNWVVSDNQPLMAPNPDWLIVASSRIPVSFLI